MILIYTFILVLGLYLLFKSKITSRKRKKPPGPKGLPLVGCALEINEHNLLDKLFKYAEEYGAIFGLNALNENVICLNSEEVVRKALATEPYRQFTNDRGKYFLAETMLYGGQSVGLYRNAYSSVHSEMRKGIINGLHVYGQEGINEFEVKILKELDRLSQKIESFGDSDFDVVSLLQRSLTNVTSLVLSGEVLADDDKDVNMFWDFVDGFNYFSSPAVNHLLTKFPFLRHVPGYRSKYKYMCNAQEKLIQKYFNNRKALPEISAILDEIIFFRKCIHASLWKKIGKKRVGILANKTGTSTMIRKEEIFETHSEIRNRAQGEPTGLIDYLIETQMKSLQENKEVIFTDERIKSNLLEFVLGGILTTWSVLSSTFLCLINNPEYQDKVFKEVDENIERDRLPTHSDKINCPYLEALELEVHRHMTVAPTAAAHICTKDINLEGYDIAKGTGILVNIWYMHHDPKIWGDPWEFRPERFLDGDGQLLPRSHIYWKNWMSFGVGRRRCIGEQFARSRYFLYMATLLRRWKFIGSPGKFGQCDPRQMDNIVTNGTLRPKSFFCTAKRRY